MQPKVPTSISDKRGTSVAVLLARLDTVRYTPDPRRPQGGSAVTPWADHTPGAACAPCSLCAAPLSFCWNSPRVAEREEDICACKLPQLQWRRARPFAFSGLTPPSAPLLLAGFYHLHAKLLLVRPDIPSLRIHSRPPALL